MVTADASGEGRFARSLRLVGKSWSLLRRDRRLLVYPVAAMAVAALGGILVFAAAFHESRVDHSRWPYAVAAAIASYPFVVVVTFANVAFVSMAADVLDGRETTLRSGAGCAASRFACILRWAFLATVVGGLIRLTSRLPGGALVVLAAQWLLGVAWALATFFVVPVLAFERCGVREVLSRSYGIVTKRWGESVVGGSAVGILGALILMPLAAVFAVGVALLHTGHVAAGVAALALAVAAGAATLVATSALQETFRLVLYRYAVDGEVTRPFDERDLAESIRQRRTAGHGALRRWLRR